MRLMIWTNICPVLCRRDYKEEVCSKCELRENGFGSIDCPRKKIKLDNIQRGCRNLYRLCEENGLESSSLTWDMNEKGIWKEKRKGVDDYLYALKKKEESEKQRKAGNRTSLIEVRFFCSIFVGVCVFHPYR